MAIRSRRIEQKSAYNTNLGSLVRSIYTIKPIRVTIIVVRISIARINSPRLLVLLNWYSYFDRLRPFGLINID